MLNKSKIQWVKATPALTRTASEVPGLVIVTDQYTAFDEYPSLELYLKRAQADAILNMDVINPFTAEGKLWISWGTSDYHMLYNAEEGVKAIADLSSTYYDETEGCHMVLAWVKRVGIF